MTVPEIDVARVICALHELGDPGAHGFTVGRGDWPLRGFVVRQGAQVRGYVNHCPHAGHPLNAGPHAFLASDLPVILCSSHGAVFEIETGLCVAGPCAGARLRAIALTVSHGYVMLADDVELCEPTDLGG